MTARGAIWGRGAAALVIVLFIASPEGAHAASPTGSAETANTVLSLSVAGTTASVGADEAAASRGSTDSAARASFTAGQAAASTIGSLERSGTAEADSGSDAATVGDLSIEGLVALTLVEAAASVELSSSAVSSTADATLASIDLMDGLVSLEGLVSSTSSEVTSSYAEAVRSISLDGLQVFDVDGLLDALGTTITAVPCAGVEGVAAVLGVDASDACEQLTAAQAALADARADLAAIAGDLEALQGGHDEATVEADRAAAAALACAPLDALCIADALATLTVLSTIYAIDLSDPTNLATTRAEVVAALDELLAAFADEGAIDAAIADAAAGRCDETVATLADAEAALSAEDPAGAAGVLAAARAAVSGACDALRATVDEVSATPVVRLDDVVITMTVRAEEGASAADVVVSIGAVTVGVNDAIAVADLEAGLAAADALAEEIASIVEALGLDAPTPAIELFAVSTTNTEGADGDRSADAMVTILQLTQPAGTIAVPDEEPFAVLGGDAGAEVTGGGVPGILGAAPGAFVAAAVPAPEVVMRVITFEAAAAYAPASADPPGPGGGGPGSDGSGSEGSGAPGGGDDDDLPLTGFVDLVSYALLLLACAGLGRRFLAVR